MGTECDVEVDEVGNEVYSRKSGGSSRVLCCMVLHAGSSILKTVGSAMKVMAIASFARA